MRILQKTLTITHLSIYLEAFPENMLTSRLLYNSLPFEDPTVVIRASGQAIWSALENSVSLYPALEGRFPQISGMTFDFDPSKAPFQRVKSASIGGEEIDLNAIYSVVTRDYMLRGKDGYDSLVMSNVEVVVGADEGTRIYEIVLDTLARPGIRQQTYRPRKKLVSKACRCKPVSMSADVGSVVHIQCGLMSQSRSRMRSRKQKKAVFTAALIAPTIEGRIRIL